MGCVRFIFRPDAFGPLRPAIWLAWPVTWFSWLMWRKWIFYLRSPSTINSYSNWADIPVLYNPPYLDSIILLSTHRTLWVSGPWAKRPKTKKLWRRRKLPRVPRKPQVRLGSCFGWEMKDYAILLRRDGKEVRKRKAMGISDLRVSLGGRLTQNLHGRTLGQDRNGENQPINASVGGRPNCMWNQMPPLVADLCIPHVLKLIVRTAKDCLNGESSLTLSFL